MVNTILHQRYRLEVELGRGGMGVVYRARDLQLDRDVAIKVLPPEFNHDQQFLARFKNEVRNTARLAHPHIVSVFDVGTDGATQYYVMQFVEGCDLKSRITREGRLPLEETAGLLAQVASALDYAHAQGIIHRDIKPENILIDRQGVARVTDFGIARSLEGTRITGGLLGTPEYMSPQQARGEEIDGRSDQYALAIVAYEMLTGTSPFRAVTAQPWAIIAKHIQEAPPHPRQHVPDLPDATCTALLRGLAKSPAERFSSCAELVSALRGNVKTPADIPHYATPTVMSPAAPPPVFSPWKAIAVTAVLVVLLAGGGTLIYMSARLCPFHKPKSGNARTPVTVQKPVANPPLPPVLVVPEVTPPAGHYFIIMGSFPHAQWVKADERLRKLENAGVPGVRIIDSDDYPNLRDGLWVAVSGPYQKAYAVTQCSDMKAFVKDCYVKSGW
jgi:serine/threonine protein kinase